MTTLVENLKNTAHYLVSEANGYRSRGVGTIVAGSGALSAGAVLGRITVSKKYAPYNPAAVDGSETAVAILYEGCDATTVDQTRTLTVRDAEVHTDVLVFTDGMSAPNKTAAMAALETRGIVGR